MRLWLRRPSRARWPAQRRSWVLLPGSVWLFARGFTDYLDAVADERMAMAAKRLAARFRQEGSWEFLREDPAMFGAMVDPNAPDGPPPSRDRGPRGMGP